MERSDWIACGLKLLAEKGIDNVRVETLAARLGVTKGGFYWHFTNREALLIDMVESWRRHHTLGAAKLVREATDDPVERTMLLFKIANEDRDEAAGGRLEQAIRQWAAVSELPRAIIRQVDAERLQILAEFNEAMGVPSDEAKLLAYISCAFNAGSAVLYPELGKKALQSMREQCAAVLLELVLSKRPPST